MTTTQSRARANLNWLADDKEVYYIAVVKKNHSLLYARIKARPGGRYPPAAPLATPATAASRPRTLKTAHVGRLDFPHARQAIKIARRWGDATTGKSSRETVYAVTSLTSAQATAHDLARLVREHWSIEAHHHIQGHDIQRRHRHQPYRQRACQPARHHRDHQRLRLPARPGRPTRPHHPAETLYLHGLD